MRKKPDWLKKAENNVKKATTASGSILKKAGQGIQEQVGNLDKEYNLSTKARSAMETGLESLKKIDEKNNIREKTRAASKSVTNATTQAAKKVVSNKTLVEAKSKIIEYADDSGFNEKYNKVVKVTSDTYGGTRAFIKPYFAPETPEQLLQETKRELIYINACILQISRGEAEQFTNRLGAVILTRLGTAVFSKITGVAVSGSLLTLVSVFGTAGTGTAIASLSGAAATNATLAWIGSIFGGGMAAGAFVTGGVALGVGLGVYQGLKSQARQIDELSEEEQRIVETTAFLIAVINESLESSDQKINLNDAEFLLNNTIRPLHQKLQEQCGAICSNLDNKNQLLFKQHALIDFEKQVIDGFEFFIKEEIQARRQQYPEYAIAGVLYGLLTQSVIDDSVESQLALDAIRRMAKKWNGATEATLSADLSEYDAEELRGVANNVKGIYHELLFVHQYNSEHEDTYAEIFEETNHPSADVKIISIDTDEVIQEFQLKASSSVGIVVEHFEKYPDIDVLATSEIADKVEGSDRSGISNVEITGDIDSTIEDLADNTEFVRATESAMGAGLIAAGREAIEILNGNKTADKATIDALKSATVAGTSTAIVAFLFS